MAVPSKPLLQLAVLAVLLSSSTTVHALENVTNIQFYMHDVISGPNQTAVRVAGQNPNATGGSDPVMASFGSIYVMDNLLTAAPSLNSTVVGRAQGLYAMSSQNELSLLMALTYWFTGGPYNGSSFSIVGWNPVMRGVREMPVVGGTGAFRLARGYCLAQTYSVDPIRAVIGYNVTLIH
ncbi:dirigent protein 22-like [Malania oleifera]|uniref:dirigent protein 22-like n=1 Tax=Malania oleifera TaxID=397392 RepID=UPI0025ADAD13|nr:dirigent protein 22-like [Malania oleifera]